MSNTSSDTKAAVAQDDVLFQNPFGMDPHTYESLFVFYDIEAQALCHAEDAIAEISRRKFHQHLRNARANRQEAGR